MPTKHSLLPLSLFTMVFVIGSIAGCRNQTDSEPVVKKSKSVTRVPSSDRFSKVTEFLSRQPMSAVGNNENEAGTRFDTVNDSGVDFTNHLKRENHLKLIETGSGVALADVDDDGFVDIYLLSTDGPNKLYRGNAQFKFDDVTELAGVDGSIDGNDVWGAGASFADVDNDGDLDLFVCNMAAANLLYINDGAGNFTEASQEAGLDYQGASKVGSFCDFDHDGDLDLYLLTNQDSEASGEATIRYVDGNPTVHPDFLGQYEIVDGRLVHAGQADILYCNNGDGTFSDISESAGIVGYDLGLSVSWFDFNGDGWQDIYVGNDFKTPDHLYRNNGDGTFTDVIADVTHHTPWFSMGADSGDLNNDGLIDLMVADMSGTTHYKQKVNMGDMSDSGWFLTYGSPRQYMRNALFINSGTDRFMDAAFMAGLDSSEWTWAVRFADLDNDGLLDVFITNGHARNSNDSDFAIEFNKLKETLSREELNEIGLNVPPLKETNLVFKNNGDLNFEPRASEWGLDFHGVSHGAAFADFDRDGDLDMVINNLNESAIVYENKTSEGNRLLVELRGTRNNRFGVGATVEIWSGDSHQLRNLIPVRGYLSSDEPIVHFGLGSATIVDRLRVVWPGGRVQEFNDLDANYIYRITEDENATLKTPSAPSSPLFRDVASDIGVDSQHVEIEFNDYLREPLLPYQLSQMGPGMSWSDVNGDGRPDAFVGGANMQAGALLINQGGKFEEVKGPWTGDLQHEDMGALFFDANGDGADDLYIVSGSNEFKEGNKILRDRLYINNGQGEFEKADDDALPEFFDSGSCVCAADFDHDGDLDLFVGSRSISGKYPLVPKSRLLLNHNGKFTDSTTTVSTGLEEIGLVNSALWTDFDQDGWIDLVVALDWGPVTFFKNNEGKLTNVTAELGLSEQLGWWHGLAAGDFDQDGDLDYIATNQGLNTKYHCNAKHPHRLYYSDFDDSGTLDLVEAEFEGDTEFPVRGRSCSSRSMPFIKEKFTTFHDFALAPLEDIYTPDIKNRPYHEVNELQSMVIWNEGEQGMRMEPLPRFAQISPSFGVAAGDFDADGNLDVLLGQNFFGSQAETGFMDGGLSLLLRGDGNQSFEPVWPAKSGIVVPDDATAVTTVDFDRDGDLDAAIATNNGPLRFFENLGESKPSFKRIVLKGIGGNTSAVGATVLVESANDSKQAFQISAGGSYLGQSSKEILFYGDAVAVSVQWPDGTTSRHENLGADETIVIQQPVD